MAGIAGFKKGQVESMGLVIIVIILVLAGVFAVVLMSYQKVGGVEEGYLLLNANNLRESILKTELCKGVSVQEEISACVGGGGYSLCFNNCEGFKGEVKRIIEGSIARNVNYEFVLSTEITDNSVVLSRGRCNIEKSPSASQHLVSGVDIKVILCFS